ncbi:hypothetical protein CVT25_013305 [Psilocybe cyanescens]|uniref:Uncharacterized protein n=1 Tax=Psilocybe cyanescens TaxID=93625 RepID=A0A409XWM4_PSICY|nr:hypothetical protein CVT25_013305 [Psilocybe cyanescens]
MNEKPCTATSRYATFGVEKDVYTGEWELYRGSQICNMSVSSAGIPESVASNSNTSFQNGQRHTFVHIHVSISAHV